uniref:Uncharacterized protein n=1 Tax=Cacopsylla melanoneura TaxID=428564 RepID=A0A8D8SQM8_9HEMI
MDSEFAGNSSGRQQRPDPKSKLEESQKHLELLRNFTRREKSGKLENSGCLQVRKHLELLRNFTRREKSVKFENSGCLQGRKHLEVLRNFKKAKSLGIFKIYF